MRSQSPPYSDTLQGYIYSTKAIPPNGSIPSGLNIQVHGSMGATPTHHSTSTIKVLSYFPVTSTVLGSDETEEVIIYPPVHSDYIQTIR